MLEPSHTHAVFFFTTRKHQDYQCMLNEDKKLNEGGFDAYMMQAHLSEVCNNKNDDRFFFLITLLSKER